MDLCRLHHVLGRLTACGLIAAGLAAMATAAEGPPNILFVLADDMGWQDTSVPFAPARTKWNDRFRTPALERLAREGMKFTQAYSCAVCSPSRVSLITGLSAARHGVTPPGSVNDTPVMIHDWFPTLLGAAGVTATADVDGLDLEPLLRGGSPAAFDRPLVWHFPNFWGPLGAAAPVEGPGMGPCSAIRRRSWKLIWYYADRRVELYDLAADPGETTNLADREPARVRDLAGELAGILRECEAPLPAVAATGAAVPLPGVSGERPHGG